MIYCFDIDGTICSSVESSQYQLAKPFKNMLDKINSLFDEGHKIYFMTARGSVSGKDWTEFTRRQLDDWGFKYHKLITNQKPHAHYFIDDKGYNAADWAKEHTNVSRGVLAGAFDVIHPGYIHLFEESKKYCTHLTILLHEDPSINDKMKPILTTEERIFILSSIKFIDDIIVYETEEDLEAILRKNQYDVRILGSDYLDKKITGHDLCTGTAWIDRGHGWSTTKFKGLIADSYKEWT